MAFTAINLREFEIAMETASKDLSDRDFPLFQKKVAIDLLRSLFEKTPVDTGRARGNWRVGIEVGDEEVLDITTRAEAAASLAQGLLELVNAPAFANIILFNNVPYILRLEHGHSDQRPAGFVAQSLDEVQQTFAGLGR